MIIGGREFESNAHNVIVMAKTMMPGPVQKYFVELEARDGKFQEFPIKQIVRAVLNVIEPDWDEHGFTAHRARDFLVKLNFTVKVRT
jgi:hypothetical protein